jgi:hypothetical protein
LGLREKLILPLDENFSKPKEGSQKEKDSSSESEKSWRGSSLSLSSSEEGLENLR